MKSIEFTGVARTGSGKKLAALLRREGLIPCIMYGGKNPVQFTASEKSFDPIINTPEVYLVNVSIDGVTSKAILKEVQYHPVTDRVLHADFLQVSDKQEVSVKVPVKFVGTSKGVREGGKLLTTLRKLNIKAEPANLPDGVEIDISNLAIGDKVRVSDLANRSYKITDSSKSVIVAVKQTRNTVKAEVVEEKKK